MEEPRMTPKASGKRVVLFPEMRSMYVGERGAERRMQSRTGAADP